MAINRRPRIGSLCLQTAYSRPSPRLRVRPRCYRSTRGCRSAGLDLSNETALLPPRTGEDDGQTRPYSRIAILKPQPTMPFGQRFVRIVVEAPIVWARL